MPIYLDPSAGSPSVIQIGGVCYTLVGTVSVAPDTTSYDAAYPDCDTCTCCSLDMSRFSGSFTAVTFCNTCSGQTNGTSSLSFSGTGSQGGGGFFTSNPSPGVGIRDPIYTCTDPAGYAWEATCTVTCNHDGTFSTVLTVGDGCGTAFSAAGSGTLACVHGTLTGMVMASGNDNHGNPVTVTFTFG